MLLAEILFCYTCVIILVNKPQKKEYIVSILDSYIMSPVTGNRVLIFLVNSADEEAYAAFYLGVLPALNHFGIPFRILDVSGDNTFTLEDLESAGVILAHDGVGSALTFKQLHVLDDAISKGQGIVSFDGRLWESTTTVHEWFGLSNLQQGEIDGMIVTDTQHYVTGMQDSGQLHKLRLPVRGSDSGKIASGFSALMSDKDGKAVLVAKDCSGNPDGRRIAFLFSPEIWLRQYFGHGMGLDDLFWRFPRLDS